MLWFITSFFIGTLNKITFNKQGCHLPQWYGPQTIPDAAELVLCSHQCIKLALTAGWPLTQHDGQGYQEGRGWQDSILQDYITTVCLWNQLGQHAIGIRIPKPTSNYFNQNTSLWKKKYFSKNFYFATLKLIWCINVKWIHKALYVEIKAVFLYIHKQCSSKQGTVSLNRQLPT